MKRNFDTLEVGKTYVSEEEPNDAVKIQSQDPYYNGQYRASNGHNYYRRDGKAVNHSYDLITEVTVTITPVERPKPPKLRETFLLFTDGICSGNSLSKEGAEKLYNIRELNHPSKSHVIIHMREVVEGDA